MSRSYLIIDAKGMLALPADPGWLVVAPGERGWILIDQIRQLNSQLGLKPFAGHKRSVLILKAQKMTREAQNALLKVLEEPPENTTIILAVDHPDNLLPTIVSRCLKISKLKSRSLVLEETLEPKTSKMDYPASSFQLPASDTDALKLAEDLAKKDRPEIIQILDNWLINLRQNLRQNPSPVTPDQIRKITYARQVIAANVNKRLALENLFLALS